MKHDMFWSFNIIDAQPRCSHAFDGVYTIHQKRKQIMIIVRIVIIKCLRFGVHDTRSDRRFIFFCCLRALVSCFVLLTDNGGQIKNANVEGPFRRCRNVLENRWSNCVKCHVKYGIMAQTSPRVIFFSTGLS